MKHWRLILSLLLLILGVLLSGCKILTAPIGWAVGAYWVAHDDPVRPVQEVQTNRP